MNDYEERHETKRIRQEIKSGRACIDVEIRECPKCKVAFAGCYCSKFPKEKQK